MDPLRVLFVSPHTVFLDFESLLNTFVSLNSKKNSNFIWNEFFLERNGIVSSGKSDTLSDIQGFPVAFNKTLHNCNL